MRSAIQIQEAIGSLNDELAAIVAAAESDSRELTDEENSRVDAITDAELPELHTALERRQKIDTQRKAIAANRLAPELDRQELEAADSPDAKLAAVKVPARARTGRKLVAFDGANAERDAYVAGHFILASICGRQRSIDFGREHGVFGTMGGGTDDLKGGNLVPDEMAQTIVRLRDARGVFSRFARNYPMGSDVVSIPRLITDVTAYWGAEATAITASDAETGQAKLVADKLTALTKLSTELDEDAIVDIGDTITQSIAYAFADKLDNAGFNGDGTSTYGGIKGLANALNANATVDAASGNVSAATLDLADFEDVVGTLPEYEVNESPRWFMNKTAYWNSARRLMDAAGGNTISDLGMGGEPMFLGYPVTFAQVMSSGAAVSTFVAYFGWMNLGATLGSRRGIRFERSADRYFEEDVIAIKGTQRATITIHETGDTVRTRPIVGLKTAAS